MKNKLLLPVTDWDEIQAGETLWRDGREYSFVRIESDTLFPEYPIRLEWTLGTAHFAKTDTFLREVTPVVMFEGHGWDESSILIDGDIGASIRSSEIKQNPLEESEIYTLIVLKGGTK